MKIKAIDISHHNGNVDFKKVINDGIGNVIIRAGYGVKFTEDKQFKRNVTECERLGIPYGIYLYSYATNISEAKEEVEEFIKAIKGYKPSLPVVIDTEDADNYRKKHGDPSFESLSDMLVLQLKSLESAGYYAMYYCNVYWYNNLSKYNDLEPYDLWIADWRTGTEPVKNASIWQYTSKGPSYGDGILFCDMNYVYKDYPSIIKKAGLNGFSTSENKSKDKAINLIDELKTVIKEM